MRFILNFELDIVIIFVEIKRIIISFFKKFLIEVYNLKYYLEFFIGI